MPPIAAAQVVAATLTHAAVLTAVDTLVSEVIERLDSGWALIPFGICYCWEFREFGTAQVRMALHLYKLRLGVAEPIMKAITIAIAGIMSFQDCLETKYISSHCNHVFLLLH